MYVENHVPTIPKITIGPVRPTKIHDLICSIVQESADKDNDTVTYDFKWYKNDVLQILLSLTETTSLVSTIPAEFTEDGESWKCVVQAKDGYFSSANVETPIVYIKNFQPNLNNTPFEHQIYEDTIAENLFKLDYVFLDDNGEDLTIEWNTSKYVKVIENNSWISFEPDPDWFGKAKFRFTARDYFTEVYFDFILSVESVNDLPVIEPIGDLEAYEGQWFNYTIIAYDSADNEEVTINSDITKEISGLITDNNYKFSQSTGELQILPDNKMVGTYQINISAEDSKKGLVYVIVNLTIHNVNNAPEVIITSPGVDSTFKKGETVHLDGNDSIDADELHGDTIQFSWELDGKVISTKAEDTYKFNSPGTFNLILRVNDSEGEESTASVTINILKDDDISGGDIIGDISENPSAITGIVIVVIIIIMIIIVILVTRIRAMKDKKKLIEAGFQKPGDSKETPTAPAAPGQIPPGVPQQQLGYTPPPLPVELPTIPEAEGGVPKATLADTGAEVPALPAKTPEEADKEAKPEDEEVKQPEFGAPLLSPDELIPVHEELSTKTMELPEPVSEKDEGEEDDLIMKKLTCPKCGTPAQDHPSNKELMICPVCGEMKSV
jgi:hypothetical protein